MKVTDPPLHTPPPPPHPPTHPPPPFLPVERDLVHGLKTKPNLAQLIKGRITDLAGVPLPGVHVSEKGTANGTISDVNGNYAISVNEGAVLCFSFVGYNAKEAATDGHTEINVELKEERKTVGEVVVTALGIGKDSRRIGYAVATVSGDQMNKARESNVALSLQGTVAGLNVKGTSGGPGGTAQILLRGLPSMNSGGSPLF